MRIFLALILLIGCYQSSIVFNPVDNTTFKIHTTRYLHTSLKKWEPFTIPLIPGGASVSEMQACNRLNISISLNGLGVVVVPGGGCSFEQHGEVGKKTGASAVFMIGGDSSDYTACIKGDDNKYNQSVPILLFSTKDFLKIAAEYEKNVKKLGYFFPVFITVIDDPNEWIKMTGGGGMIFFQVITELIMMVTLIFGIKGQISFAMDQGIKPTAAQLCLLFNNLCLIMNIILVFDIYAIRRWYVFGLFIATNIYAAAFTMIASISLAYFFQELLLTKKMYFPGISYFRIPFIMTSVALMILYTAFIIVVCLYRSTPEVTRAIILVPSGIFFALIVFFSMGGFKILLSMKKFKKKGMMRMAVTVYLSVLGMFIQAVSLLVFGIIPLSEKPLLAYLIIVVLAQIMTIVPQVFTFNHPKFSEIKTSKGSSNITASKFKDEGSNQKSFSKNSVEMGSSSSINN